MASTAPAPQGWTYQQYLELDDETRYEILDGELLVTPAPGTRHQAIAMEIAFSITRFVKERNTGIVFFAPTDVVLSETRVVQPDVLFIRAERVTELVKERAVHGAPDLVIEILSPSSHHRDRHRKRALYASAGVPEFWIVDPANRTIEVFTLGENGYEISSFAAEQERAESRVLKGWSVAVEEILGG